MSIFKDPYEDFLLNYLATKLKQGANTKKALVLYSEQLDQNNGFKRRLDLAIKDMNVGRLSLEHVLYKHKFLTKFEYNIVTNSRSMLAGLELILSFKQTNTNLIFKMLTPILLPMSVIIGTFLSLRVYLDFLFVDIVKLKEKNPDVVEYLGVPNYFTYEFSNFGIVISSLITIIIFVGYLYAEQFKPQLVYKFLKTQAYSDGRYLFRILNGMLSAGISMHKTTAILSTEYFKTGIRPLFNDLSTSIHRNRKIYKVFEEYNYPKLLTSDIKMSEISKTSFATITHGLYMTCDSMYEKNIAYLVGQWKFMFWLLATVVVVVIGSDILNVLISSFTFKTLYS